MFVLYQSPVCPFAQRTRALLAHLGADHDSREIDLDDRPPEFLKLAPTGRVPLIVEGKTKLWESRIVNDYLATKLDFGDAYSDDPQIAARERLAMVHWDDCVVRMHMRALRDPDSFDAAARKLLAAHLSEIAHTLHLTKNKVGTLLSFHCAPFWARMSWMREDSPVPAAIDEFIAVRSWLQASLALPAIQSTLPDEASTVERYREKFVGDR